MERLLPFFLLILVFSLLSGSKKGKGQNPNAAQQAKRDANPAQTAPPRPTPARAHQTVAPAQPTVKVSRHDHSGMFDGSLYADDSGEGKDIHDHGFTHEVETPSMSSDTAINASIDAAQAGAQEAENGSLSLRFDGQSIVNAVVMNEILRRRTH